MTEDLPLDLLAIDAFTWSPHLETTCEICLCEAERGRRVGFLFLDVENPDELLGLGGDTFAPWQNRVLSGFRRRKVRFFENMLRARGVAVLPSAPSSVVSRRMTCAALGIDSVTSLRAYRADGAALGLGVLSSLISQVGDIDPDITAHRVVTNRLLTAAHRTFDLARAAILALKPREVLVFNGRYACSKAIDEAARLSGARTLYHEVGATLDRYYYSDRGVHSASDARTTLQEAWTQAGQGREEIAAAFFTPWRNDPRLLEKRFANPQRKGESLPATGRRRIVYYASSIDEYAAVEDGLDLSLFASQRAAVEWLVSWVRTDSCKELIIRLHPRMRRLAPAERRWWMSLSGPNVTTLPAEDPVDSYALAATADRVVCFNSTLGAEATFMGRVSILVGDASYRGLDCVYEPATIEELTRMLEDPSLPPKPPSNCLPFGYYRLKSGTTFRFYEPTSFRGGSFFGKPVPVTPPIPTRLAAKCLTVMNSLDRIARSGLRSVTRGGSYPTEPSPAPP